MVKQYTQNLVEVLSLVDDSVVTDVIMLCLCVLSVDGKVTLKERNYLSSPSATVAPRMKLTRLPTGSTPGMSNVVSFPRTRSEQSARHAVRSTVDRFSNSLQSFLSSNILHSFRCRKVHQSAMRRARDRLSASSGFPLPSLMIFAGVTIANLR